MILATIFTTTDQEDQFSNIAPENNGSGNSNDPDSEEVERENNDKELLPDEDDDDDKVEKDDDFEKNYGHLDNGQDDLSTPDSGGGVDNLE